MALCHISPLAIGCVANCRKQGSNALDQLFPLHRVGEIKSGLHDVVSITVTKKLVKLVLVQDFIDKSSTGFNLRNADALNDFRL